MLSDSLVESFRARLDALGLELADLRIGGTQHRPLVQVRIEWPPSEPPRRVTVDDCGTASRALEAWLDADGPRSEEHTSELQSHSDLVCRLLLEKKKKKEKQSRTC